MTDKHWEIDEEDLDIWDRNMKVFTDKEIFACPQMSEIILRIYTNLHDLNKRLKALEEKSE